LDYWQEYPPINVSAAAFMGIKKNAKKIFSQNSAKSIIVESIELEPE